MRTITFEKFNPHAKYWDCYNDVPLEENHDKQCALICVEKILEEATVIQTEKFWQQVKSELSNK